jgi:NADPH2:quinone reductase
LRAAVIHTFGDPDDLVVEEVADPVPGVGEVVVEVEAAAVNFPDLLIMRGEYQISWPPPIIPGSEFAGRVRALGRGVEGLELGDRVCGALAMGAFAERVVASAARLWKVPDSIDPAEAAAFRVTYLTSYQALRSVAEVRRDEWVVVLGASGGVGLAAIHVAKLFGAKVLAAASTPEKLALCREQGADATVDYSAGSLKDQIKEATGGGADVVFDPVGGDHSEQAIRATRWGGRYVCVGFASGAIPRIPMNLVLLKGVTLEGFSMGPFAEHHPELAARDEGELYGHFIAGALRPHIGARFPLDEVAAALKLVQLRQAVGKVVIDVGPS